MSNLIPISVRQDHLEQLSHVTRPVDALAELIWNAFDADATAVHVQLRQNALGGVEGIVVSDNGTGIYAGHAASLFGNLGESWKRGRVLNGSGRRLHGRKGRGRFKAFGLGSLACWETRCRTEEGLVSISISGDITRMDGFRVEDPVPSLESGPGTRVSISALHRDCGALLGPRGVLSLAQLFGPFLAANPDAELWLDGEKVVPALVQERSEESGLTITGPGGAPTSLVVRIVEWTVDTERHIHLCDEAGLVLHSVRVGSAVRAKNCSFTAYVRSPLIARLAEESRLSLDELDPVVAAIVDAARGAIRGFLQAREDGRGADVVAAWRAEGIHPFAEDKAAPGLELFEQAALQVTRRWAGLSEAGAGERKLLLALVAKAAQSRPAELAALIDDSLGLDKRGRERLQRLASAAASEGAGTAAAPAGAAPTS